LTTDKPIPFSVSRNDARTLLAQVTDGFREAIVSGYYLPGDVLPATRDLKRLLGVSRIISIPAFKQLASEGYVVSRPRLGTVVRNRGVKQWLGHVVMVSPDHDISYFHGTLVESLRTNLNKAGYLFTRATVERNPDDGSFDFSTLDAVLARSVDLVLVLYLRPAILRHLTARGVPFALLSSQPEVPSGAIGFTRFDFNAAVPDFVAACRAAGVKKVMQLRLAETQCDSVPAFSAAGITATSITVTPDFSKGKFEGIEQAGLDAFSRLIDSGCMNPDTLFFFADDYLARGALTAMMGAGLRAPEDLRFATWANFGFSPVYFRSLARIGMEPAAAGAATAKAVLAYLKTGHYPVGSIVPSHWHKGETLGHVHGRRHHAQ